VNINFFGVPSSEQAEVIRRALPAHARVSTVGE
jgi:hypothetical protein